MSWYTRMLRERITYWAPGTPDGYGGTTFGTPVLINAKSQQRIERSYDAEGVENASDSAVLTDQRLERGGYVAFGDQTVVNDPETLHEAFEVTESREESTLSTRITVYRVLLQEASRPG